MSVSTQLRNVAVVLLLLALAPAAAAATYCVNSVNQLLAAIEDFRNAPEGTLLTVKIVRGNYQIGNALGNPDLFPTGFTEDVKLQLLGGYAAGCGSRTLNPANTVLDGLNQTNSGISVVAYGDSAQLLVEGLTFTRFQTAADHYNGATLNLDIITSTSDNGITEVRYCRFVQNTGTRVVGLAGPRKRLVNNLIADNTLRANTNPDIEPAAFWFWWGESGNDPVLYAANNTIVNNIGGVGMLAGVQGSASDRPSEIVNNIIWGNSNPQIQFREFDPSVNLVFLNHNIYSSIEYLSLGNGNLSSDPLFTAAASGNYTLQTNSPGVNSGGLFLFNAAPTQDLTGGARVIGSAIDRGAYESSFNNLTTSIVTTTADNGNNTSPTPGSLRAAVKAANASGMPYEIRFAISGGCPQMITLAAPMLDIVGNVHIDGSTQPGWVANSVYGELNATLCLFLNGNSTSTHAFLVPASANNARLAVEGLIFASFSDAAIRLDGGSGHRISGNQFGAVPFTSANGAAIRVSGNSGGALIGGFDNHSAVNLIAGSSSAGIYLDNTAGGSVVGNNVIGFQPNGTLGVGNSIGVFIFNSPRNNIQYNYIGHSMSNGITISGAGSSGNIVQNNSVGASRTSSAGNSGAGIGVIFAAHGNTIGASQGGSPNGGANLIVESGGPGVWISNSGGAGNRVLANNIYANGGLSIDLAAAGASANQASNPAVGPNNLQNYPVLSSAVRNQSAMTVRVGGSLHSIPDTSFRVDVYFDAACDASAPSRATAGIWLGRSFVLTNAAGDSNFSFDVPSYTFPGLGVVGAIATSPGGDTSEIGNCAVEVSGTLPDFIFGSGFE